jgi:all-trans-8'-apo-beta-carotenal 15,15'-oxygenase
MKATRVLQHSKNQSSTNETSGMTRRRFAQLLGAAGALGLVDSPILAKVFADTPKRLSWLAYRTAGAEGAWALTKVEGKIPKDLQGTLYRIAPGQKDNRGIMLKHLFDGDAFTSAYSFRDGKVFLKAKFLDTPQRLEEIKLNRMLYNEFGTMAPPRPADWSPTAKGGKNQPSVNVIHWDNRLLGLSEGGHPTAIDPQTLSFQKYWDFYGTLSRDMSFTAHPKFDPATGLGYCFGVQQGPTMALTVYRMEKDGKLTKLYALPQKGYYMIHDMMLAKDHIIFVVPPVRYNLNIMFSGKAVPADAVQFFEKESTRIIVLRKDGKGTPVTIEQPSNMVFHHGNAFERDGKIVFDSVLSPDGTVLSVLYAWDKDSLPKQTETRLTRLVLDPVKGTVESRAETETAIEFPRFDSRRTGNDARFLYTLDGGNKEDQFAMNILMRHDLHKGNSKRIDAGKTRVFGEPVFVPHPTKDSEERGWILLQGYDATRDKNFLEIRDAGTMDFVARAWTESHYPLGFHGNFYPDVFVGA